MLHRIPLAVILSRAIAVSDRAQARPDCKGIAIEIACARTAVISRKTFDAASMNPHFRYGCTVTRSLHRATAKARNSARLPLSIVDTNKVECAKTIAQRV